MVIEYSVASEVGEDTVFLVEPCDGIDGIENFYSTTNDLQLITFAVSRTFAFLIGKA